MSSLSASNLASGTVPSSVLSGTYSNALAFSSPSNSFAGAFTGNGAGLTGVNAALLNGSSSSAFQPAGSYAGLGANTFGGNQSVTGNVSATGSVSGGTATFMGALTAGGATLPATGTATSNNPFSSNPLDFVASSFNGASAVNEQFRWQAEGNGSADTGTLNLLTQTGGAALAETGLLIHANGQIAFAAGQTFPGTGGGTITGITAGSGLSGGGTSGNVSLAVDSTVARTNTSDTFSGTLTATSFTGSGAGLTNLPAANLSGAISDNNLPGDVARLGVSNTFTTGQSVALSSSGNALSVQNTGSGNGVSAIGGSAGVSGTGGTYGLYGTGFYGAVGGSSSSSGYGLYGYNGSTSGTTYGVLGYSASSAGYGVYGSGSTGVYGASSSSSGYGLYGYNTASSGTTYGVYGVSSSSAGYGVYGTGSTGLYGTGGSTGTGVFGYSGSGIGVEAFITSNSAGTAVDAIGGTYGVFGFGTSYGVYSSGNLGASGTKSAVVALPDDRVVSLYAVESPENWFEDFGSGQLNGGTVTIELDPTFAQTVNPEINYHVFLTPNGDCEGLYVAQKSPTSFEVRELRGGKSSVAFDYRIVAKRKGLESLRLEEVSSEYDTAETIRKQIAERPSHTPKLELPKPQTLPEALGAPPQPLAVQLPSPAAAPARK